MHFDLRTSLLSNSPSRKQAFLKPLSVMTVAIAAFGSMSSIHAETFFY
ncbi:hypothetical protein [Psychrobacter sp. AOP7-A1-24]